VLNGRKKDGFGVVEMKETNVEDVLSNAPADLERLSRKAGPMLGAAIPEAAQCHG
jgi:hypothetical protein